MSREVFQVVLTAFEVALFSAVAVGTCLLVGAFR